MKCTFSARVDNFSIRKANYGLLIQAASAASRPYIFIWCWRR